MSDVQSGFDDFKQAVESFIGTEVRAQTVPLLRLIYRQLKQTPPAASAPRPGRTALALARLAADAAIDEGLHLAEATINELLQSLPQVPAVPSPQPVSERASSTPEPSPSSAPSPSDAPSLISRQAPSAAFAPAPAAAPAIVPAIPAAAAAAPAAIAPTPAATLAASPAAPAASEPPAAVPAPPNAAHPRPIADLLQSATSLAELRTALQRFAAQADMRPTEAQLARAADYVIDLIQRDIATHAAAGACAPAS
ncbi:hypothetical protein [Burkholderia sp. TSV86]|uniref:hypothetical protein n=1 Tax=Burkholderia sp. TSV86 TaxID=1385594 RepID=UPI00075D1246|nr:hypothetical protein [Burkholderia sp. TSV86]KVE33244.1 hypothetical protein WS68_12555 [Burkholderia sp. TSV86]